MRRIINKTIWFISPSFPEFSFPELVVTWLALVGIGVLCLLGICVGWFIPPGGNFELAIFGTIGEEFPKVTQMVKMSRTCIIAIIWSER